MQNTHTHSYSNLLSNNSYIVIIIVLLIIMKKYIQENDNLRTLKCKIFFCKIDENSKYKKPLKCQ